MTAVTGCRAFPGGVRSRQRGCCDGTAASPTSPLTNGSGTSPCAARRRLAAALRQWRDEALICRDLAELRTDLPLRPTVDDLAWHGADRARLQRLCDVLGDDSVIARIERWAT